MYIEAMPLVLESRQHQHEPGILYARGTTSAAYYEALGHMEGDQLQKKLEKNRKALGRDDNGL